MRWLILAAFAATIPSANWLIGNAGTECVPDGPCLIPVGFGLMAPSGVLMVGLALILRDAIHEMLGAKWAITAIASGAVLSLSLAPPVLAVASGAAFLLSEAADMAVYSPLRHKRLTAAVLASQLVGSAVDSAVFLLLAFGSLDFIEGQVLGKLWMAAFAIPVIYSLRKAR